ncbi:zf-C2H2 type zinc finger protein [Schizosaccharomyces japonicus yFS275]|uniref:Zf-C2H2 type zinc finger protein n=1 Tax=Schizosaccharomyces japonicus (strain yFS275 / FY16936) TaxID=402676 RepID=B6JWC7_SCHJY|nr:zf-C2H2 type zinc finger protein [Schizosaccharomyces japonicus yFS275]EEB05678.2 zf-C2H2 type zinc finger protein [Schizosaccharomyces japonicus yFS275]
MAHRSERADEDYYRGRREGNDDARDRSASPSSRFDSRYDERGSTGSGFARSRSPRRSVYASHDDEYNLHRREAYSSYSSGYFSRGLSDPYSLNSIVPYDRFIRWYSQENHVSATSEDLYKSLHKSYNSYKQDLFARTAESFVEKHMNEAWFQDTYKAIANEDPVSVSDVEKTYRSNLHDRFMKRLQDGAYDEYSIHENVMQKDEALDEDIAPPVPTTSYKTVDVDPLFPETPVLSIQHVPVDVSAEQINEFFEKIDLVSYYSISAPRPLHNFVRTIFVYIKPGFNVDAAMELLNEKQLADNFTILTEKVKIPEKKADVVAPVFYTKENLEKLQYLLDRVINLLAARYDLDRDVSQRIRDHLISLKASSNMEEVDQLDEEQYCDLLVLYLREVLTYDFWKRKHYGCYLALLQDTPSGYVKTQKIEDTYEPTQEETVLFSNLEFDYSCLLDSATVDLSVLGARPAEEMVEKKIEAAIGKEDEQKYRCHVGECTKLFLGPEIR